MKLYEGDCLGISPLYLIYLDEYSFVITGVFFGIQFGLLKRFATAWNDIDSWIDEKL
jgi:hypothetical protein